MELIETSELTIVEEKIFKEIVSCSNLVKQKHNIENVKFYQNGKFYKIIDLVSLTQKEKKQLVFDVTLNSLIPKKIFVIYENKNKDPKIEIFKPNFDEDLKKQMDDYVSRVNKTSTYSF